MFDTPANPGNVERGAASRGGRVTVAVGSLLVAAGLAAPVAAQDVFGATGFAEVWTVPTDPVVNIERCEDNRATVVGFNLDAAPTAEQRVVVSTHDRADCTEAGLIETVADRAAATGDQTVEVPAQSILPECAAVDREDRFICLTLSPVAGTTDDARVEISVLVDTVAPEPPDQISATPADSALNLTWSWTEARPGDLAEVRVFYRPADDLGDPSSTTVSGTTVSDARIRDLVNDVTYEVWVRPIDEARNMGDESESVLGTPQPTVGFWQGYKNAGGAETGGCGSVLGGSSGVATLALLLLIPAVMIRRPGARSMVRRASLLVLPAIVLAGSMPVAAKAGGDESRGWFLEFDLGPYRPDIDHELEGAWPYQEAFGDGSELLPRLRAERRIVGGFGQLGAGLSAGFAQAAGRAVFADGEPAPDATVFNWVPLQLSLTYRFDYPAIEWGIPFVPYGRAGLASTVWWIRGPTGVEVDDEGNRAEGMRHGWFYGGGLKFLLNVLDPRLATDFRRSVGVQRTYLYGEVVRMELDGFGSPGFDLSATTWFVGLAVEI